MKLIDMEKVLSELCLSHKDIIYIDKNETAERIRKIPSIDIEPKRGEWIVHKERTEVTDGFIDFFPTEYECSNCGLKQSMYFINSKPSNFCPNCGADMRNSSEKPNNSKDEPQTEDAYAYDEDDWYDKAEREGE